MGKRDSCYKRRREVDLKEFFEIVIEKVAMNFLVANVSCVNICDSVV